jgi:hypothetical protein
MKTHLFQSLSFPAGLIPAPTGSGNIAETEAIDMNDWASEALKRFSDKLRSISVIGFGRGGATMCEVGP